MSVPIFRGRLPSVSLPAVEALPGAKPLPPVEASLAADFGAKNGTEIQNKDSLQGDLDSMVGPAPVELMLGLPNFHPSDEHRFLNVSGHAALRYITPDGTDVVAHVVPRTMEDGTHRNVHVLPTKDYLFSTEEAPANFQRGVYRRNTLGARIEEATPEQRQSIHAEVERMRALDAQGKLKYEFFMAKPKNLFNRKRGNTSVEYANCANFVSKVLKEANVIPRTRTLPRDVFAEVYQRARPEAARTHRPTVVEYERVAHAQVGEPTGTTRGIVSLSRPLRNFRFWDATRLAGVKVHVPAGSMQAEVLPR